MKCAVPGCSGRGTTRNELGVCEVCLHPSSFDPTGARIEADVDFARELDRLLDDRDAARGQGDDT